jgi:hypothetical protein
VAIASDTKCEESASVVSVDCGDNESDFSDFTVVRKKRTNKTEKNDITKKCESAVLQWAKNKDIKPQQYPGNNVKKPIATKCCGDEEIICNRCGLPFVYSAKTKEKYAEKGWKAPKICKPCSQMRFEDRRS